jgi:four helix bundle protein
MLDALRELRGPLDDIERRDPDLARQLRRASSSVALNLAEGSGSTGRMRAARYRTALGSARETLACLQVAEALGYTQHLRPAPAATLHRVIGTLVRITT